MRGGPHIELEPVAWAAEPMVWVLYGGAVVGTVLPMPGLPNGSTGEACWLAAACEEAGGSAWPCASQAAAVEWLMGQADRSGLLRPQ